MSHNYDHIVLGGGAAGFFTAIHHAISYPDDRVVILDHSATLLEKVRISGGGRCNVTHSCFDPRDLIDHYPRGSKELLGPFHRFQPADTIDWFESRGVPLKTESDGRIFPVSNQSEDIVQCLTNTAAKLGVTWKTKTSIHDIIPTDHDIQIKTDQGLFKSKGVTLATGSNRRGYDLVRRLGHTIVDPVPSLFSFKVPDPSLTQLQGLSVNQATVQLKGTTRQQTDPILITHWGLSGPGIIRLSAWYARELYESKYQGHLTIDWLPIQSPETTMDWIQHQRRENGRQRIKNTSVHAAIPNRLWHYLLAKVSIAEDTLWSSLTKSHQTDLCHMIHSGDFPVSGKGAFKEEFVTCGGVDLKEIDFKTMRSKLIPRLSIVGEALNIDGITGGFNFQNAWTTGYLAGTGGS